MKAKILLLLAIIVFALMAAKSVHAQDFYSDLNAVRRKHLLPALQIDSSLVSESIQQINKIQTKWKGCLMHGSMKLQKGHKFKAEVLAKYSDLEIWLHKGEHRKIILSRKARKIGFAKIDGIACARLTD